MVPVDDTVTPLPFTLHGGDVVALLDDGSLRRWREIDSLEVKWEEISCVRSSTGSEGFRVRFRTGLSSHGTYASTQLAYNDAIAASEDYIYFGAGRVLQQLV